MEIIQKNMSLSSRLIRGEKVVCPKCGKGILVPFNPKYKVNHAYLCSDCDFRFHWDPVVIVE